MSITQPPGGADALPVAGQAAGTSPAPAPPRPRARTSLLAHGQPLVWLNGGALAFCVLMIVGLLILIIVQGLATFWPQPVVEAVLVDAKALTIVSAIGQCSGLPNPWQVGSLAETMVKADGETQVMGEIVRAESYRPDAEVFDKLPAALRAVAQAQVEKNKGLAERQLFRTGNFDIDQKTHRWLDDFKIASTSQPQWALVIERLTNDGRFYGILQGFRIKAGPREQVEQAVAVQALALPLGTGPLLPRAVAALGTAGLERDFETTDPTEAWALFQKYHPAVMQRVQKREKIKHDDIGASNRRMKEAELAVARAELNHGRHSPAAEAARARSKEIEDAAAEETQQFNEQIAALNRENARYQLVLGTAQGQTRSIALGDIDRAYPANQLTFWQKLGVYFSRWWEFLTAEPRNANSEGGVWPAIWGTAVMTILMSLAVVPFGVVAALYLREYAKPGPIVSLVRISINNLAGVPSIVFGVFGFGFFCYIVGGNFLDPLFYRAEKEVLNDPTFGKGGLLWASLTLALLTLPVVIVATEEALAAVPGSMREGSYACGASKWQTIRRIVLPRAMPGVLTGMILAMARGAGEVAPLMLVGAKKIAQDLPVDGQFPFFHPSRSFMHLGFHIYDVGFQSPDSESAKPMVFTTTLLLIALIFALNLAAMWLRGRLSKRHQAGHF